MELYISPKVRLTQTGTANEIKCEAEKWDHTLDQRSKMIMYLFITNMQWIMYVCVRVQAIALKI